MFFKCYLLLDFFLDQYFFAASPFALVGFRLELRYEIGNHCGLRSSGNVIIGSLVEPNLFNIAHFITGRVRSAEHGGQHRSE
jgi:hypothetical protein